MIATMMWVIIVIIILVPLMILELKTTKKYPLGSNNVSIYASLGTQAYLCEKHQYVNIDHPSYIVMFIMY